jgi:prolipoprotein diacylglyceryl transferase
MKGTGPLVLPLSIPSPSYAWQAFNLGDFIRNIGFSGFGFNIEIRAYAICILIGIVVATVITHRRLTKRGAEPGIVLDVAIFAVVFGIIGARVFHVLTHPDEYFGAGHAFWHVFAIWEGGIAIFGSLIGGTIGAYIGCRLTGLRLTAFLDALAPGLLLAQAFGRFGNYFNHELFGVPTTSWWGLEIEKSNSAFPAGLPAGTLFQPTFAFEIIWNVIGTLVLLYLSKKFTLQWGKTIAIYFIWYGIGRSFFESIRIDPSLIFLGVRTNIWAAWAAVLLGIIILAVQSKRHPGLEPSPYRPGREWSKTAAVHSEDTYSDDDETDSDTNDNGAEIEAVSPTGSSTATKPATSAVGQRS